MKTLLVSLALVVLLSPTATSQNAAAASLAEEVAALKRKVAALEQRLDLVISTLNRQNTAPIPATSPARSSIAAATPGPSPASSRIQCQATTRKGTQCSRLAPAGSSYCWQHGR